MLLWLITLVNIPGRLRVQVLLLLGLLVASRLIDKTRLLISHLIISRCLRIKVSSRLLLLLLLGIVRIKIVIRHGDI